MTEVDASETSGTLLGYAAVAVVAICGVVLISLAPFVTPPAPHRTAGILFGPGIDGKTSLATVVHADPGVRLVDMRWGGHLVFVTYDDVNFPATLSRAGALYMFDAIAAGCHTPVRP